MEVLYGLQFSVRHANRFDTYPSWSGIADRDEYMYVKKISGVRLSRPSNLNAMMSGELSLSIDRVRQFYFE